MKRILLIATGGTIASQKTDSGLAPQLTPEEMLGYVPDAAAFCQVDAIQALSLDSTNITPAHWLKLADILEQEYSRYDGFVICHGTDTLAYTAAALSYLVQHPEKPVVLTGAQRPIDADSTDARTNLLDALLYACEGDGGVCLVFGGHVIAGTRARKIRTKSYNAFSSINFPDLACIRDGRIIRYIPMTGSSDPRFYHTLNTSVFPLKLIPGLSPDVFGVLGSLGDGIIVESYGVGGIPDSCLDALDALLAQGKTVVMATQVPQEGSDLSVYQVGQRLHGRQGLLESRDMTLESTVTKLMWAMGQTVAPDEISRLFHTTVAFDTLY